MATLPGAEVITLDAPRPNTNVASYPGNPARLGNAISDAAGRVGDAVKKQQDEADQFDYAKARSAYLAGKVTLEGQIQDDPDWQTAPQKYDQAMKGLQATTAAGISNPRLQKQFEMEAGTDFASGLASVNHFVKGKAIDQDRADLNNLIATNSKLALGSPKNAPAFLAANNSALAGARTRGVISAVEEEAMRRSNVDTYAKGWINMLAPPQRVQVLAHRLGRDQATSASSISAAILGQESGGNPNIRKSTDGAVGQFQIMPQTFAQYAKPGEKIDNPVDNAAVGQRIIDDLSAKYPNDPARVAVGYFSGPGNVSPPGSATPYLKNTHDGNKKYVADYVADVVKRVGPAPSKGADDLSLVRQTGTPADFIAPDEASILLEQSIRQSHADSTLAREEQSQAQTMQDRQTASKILSGIYDGSVSTQAIINSNLPAFGTNSKDELLGVASKIKSGTTDPATWQTLFERTSLPDGDPHKIQSGEQLTPYVGNGLSFDDYRKLSGYLASGDTTEGRAVNDLRKGLYDQAKSALVKANLITGFSDPNDSQGRAQLQKFMAYSAKKEQEAVSKGIPLMELYDANSKNYIGLAIDRFKVTDDQRLHAATSSAPQPSQGPSLPARKPGETPEQYLTRMGGK